MTTEIPLSSGRIALVDDEDAARVLAAGAWSDATRGGYVRKTINVGGKYSTLSLSHFILGVPTSTELDHIDRNRLNNQKANLRRVTHAQNMQNVPHRTGRFRGAYFNTKHQQWRAAVTLAGKQHYLGRFDTEEEAGAAAAEWRRVHMPYSEEATRDRHGFT